MGNAALVKGLAQVSMRARDLERAVAFYRDVLGLGTPDLAPGMAFFALGAVRLMVAVPSGPEYDHPGSILYLDTADIETTAAMLEERGTTMLRKPFAVHAEGERAFWLAFFHDSEGNTLALCQWRSTRA